MTELRRLLETDEAPPEVLSLLRSARPSRPLDGVAKERSRRRISALAALPAAAGTIVWLQHAAYGAVLGAAVTGAVTIAPRVLSRKTHETPPVATRSMQHERSRGVQTPIVEPQPSPVVAPAGEPLAPRRAPSARFETSEHELSREARSLERARTLMESRPAEALEVLRRHRAEFPHGTLEIECEFLEVEAYMRLGRRSEAEASARVLRARAPGSLYESRLERLLSNGEPR